MWQYTRTHTCTTHTYMRTYTHTNNFSLALVFCLFLRLSLSLSLSHSVTHSCKYAHKWLHSRTHTIHTQSHTQIHAHMYTHTQLHTRSLTNAKRNKHPSQSKHAQIGGGCGTAYYARRQDIYRHMNYMSRVTTRASRNARLRHRSIAHARAREETEQKRKSARDNEGGIDSFSMISLKNSFFCVTRIHLLSMKAFMNSRTTKCCECESTANVKVLRMCCIASRLCHHCLPPLDGMRPQKRWKWKVEDCGWKKTLGRRGARAGRRKGRNEERGDTFMRNTYWHTKT